MLCFATKMLFMQSCFWIMSPQSHHWAIVPSGSQYHAAGSFQFSGGHRVAWWHLHLLFYILPDKEFPVRGLLSVFSSQLMLYLRRCCQICPSGWTFFHHLEMASSMLPSVFQFLNTGAFYFPIGKCQTPFLHLCVAGCVSEHMLLAQLHVIQKMVTVTLSDLGHTLLGDVPFFRGVDEI